MYEKENFSIFKNGVSISNQLDLCEKCLHANHMHITRDFRLFECLADNCECGKIGIGDT